MATTDREALVALYNATNGPNWSDSSNWNTDAELSDWYGVNLNGEGRVVELSLNQNNLAGTIPEELGNLTVLRTLWLHNNNLEGPLPKELGALSKLRFLRLYNNKLTGAVPPELGNLAGLQTLDLWSNQLSGGPGKRESIAAWKTRLQMELAKQELAEQEHAEQEYAEQELAEQSRAEEEREGREPGVTDNAPAAHSISSSGGGEGGSEHRFRAQVASFADLDELTRENREALEEVKRLLGHAASADTISDGAELSGKLGELDSLIGKAKTLGEMALKFTADVDVQMKEMSLDPGLKAYNLAVRSGLCNAYLAASVVCSGLVSTSETGVMGKVGTAFKLISGSLPVVGGLAGFAGAALEAGDCVIQTRRLAKISDLAPDAVECSKLAKNLALRLADGLSDATITNDAKDQPARDAADLGWDAGGSSSNQGSSAVTENADEEAALEWFITAVANCVSSNSGPTTPIQEAGRQVGKRHLRKLMKAVGRGCIEATSSVEEKVTRLVLVILPEADTPSAEPPNSPEGVVIQPSVSSRSHDGVLDRMAAELEAMKEKHRTEVEALKGKIIEVEKQLPMSRGRLGGPVDAGGGYLFAQEQKTETQEEFDERMENPARAADRQTVTPGDVRVIQAHVEEVGRETGHLGARVAALEENRGKKKGFRFCWCGSR